MTVTIDRRSRLGTGLYSRHRAHQILAQRDPSLTRARLDSWIRHGLLGEGVEGTLTFLDLVSLEVVRRMIEAGASPQAVRVTGEALRERYGVQQPFASDVLYVHRDHSDLSHIWASVEGELVEVVGHRPGQGALEQAVRSFAAGIHYDETRQVAVSWDLSEWIVIDPEIQFGEPTIRGTRVTVETVAANLDEGTIEELADWYLLDVEQVRGVRDYVAART